MLAWVKVWQQGPSRLGDDGAACVCCPQMRLKTVKVRKTAWTCELGSAMALVALFLACDDGKQRCVLSWFVVAWLLPYGRSQGSQDLRGQVSDFCAAET